MSDYQKFKEDAFKEGMKRFKGKQFQQLKARMFTFGAIYAYEKLFKNDI